MTLRNMTTNKIVVIVGPTATNKTKLAILLAKECNGEIISADAFQVYKQLNVGVNKPTSAQLKTIPFHLVNHLDITQKWDIKRFQDEANKIINKLIVREKLPIIVGGSHLYIDALIKNYDLSSFKERSDQFTNLTTNQLYEQLKMLDEKKAQTIINNRQRLIRALQIYASAQRASISPMNKKKEIIYDPLIICCLDTREFIYKAINARVDNMLKNGWIDEVKNLISKYPNITKLNAFKAIGYLKIYNGLQKGDSIDIDEIKRRTRQYAKRQLTWIKHHYVNPLVYDQTNTKEVITKVYAWIKD